MKQQLQIIGCGFYRKLFIILMAAYLILICSFTAHSYQIVKDGLKEDLGNKAMIMAIHVARTTSIDETEYQRLLKINYPDLLADSKNIEFEENARAVMKHSDIKYIYVLSKLSDDFIKYKVEPGEDSVYEKPVGTPLNYCYLLDAVVDVETRLKDKSGKWYQDKDRYTVSHESVVKAFEHKEPVYFINSDEWGEYITGMAPYYDNKGKFIGVVGVDLRLDSYSALLKKSQIIITSFLMALMLICFFAYYLACRMYQAEKIAYEKTILSDIDGLTSLLNRRCILEKLDFTWHSLQDKKRLISLLLIDVDYFKEYNDFYGHLAGDEVLRNIARVLSENISLYNGFAGRYGGDEFIAIITDISEDEAKQLAQQIILQVEELQIENKNSPGQLYQTISIGGATMFSQTDMTLADFFNLADEALYRAKEMGRGQVQWGK